MKRLFFSARTWRILAWLATGGALSALGWILLFTLFMPYDDEGYILESARRFSAGEALYVEVFSQYGPFYYAFNRALGWFGYPFTTDSVRVLTLVCWTGAAAFGGLLAARLAGFATGLAAFVCGFLALWRNCFEPGHPGSVLTLMTAAAAWLGVEAILARRPGRFAVIQGALGSAMALTKVNIGAFHLIATISSWPFGRSSPSGRTIRAAAGFTVGAAAVFVLMNAMLDRPEIQSFAGLFLVGTAGLALARPADEWAGPAKGPLLRAGLSGVGVAGLSLGFAWLSGTPPRDLFEAVLVAPLRHPGVYFHLPIWRESTWPLAAASLIAAVVWRFGPARTSRSALFLAKAASIFVLFRGCLTAEYAGLERQWFQHATSFAWTFAIPWHPDDKDQQPARWWAASLLCWHWLQAYPVAGSQTAWGSFLAIPLAWSNLGDLTRAVRLPILRAIALALAFFAAGKTAVYAQRHWFGTEPLGFPGAAWLRQPPFDASTLRLLALNARANGTMLFTYPGMSSLNRWFDIPPPEGMQTTHWFSLLPRLEQEKLLRNLSTAEAPVIAVQRDNLLHILEKGLGPEGPLKNYLHANFHPVLRLGGFDLWVRNDRPFIPVSIARLIETPAGVGLVLLQLTPPETVASASYATLSALHAPGVPLAWHGRKIELPLANDEQPAFLDKGRRAHRIWIPLEDLSTWNNTDPKEIRLHDKDGNIVERIRLDWSPRPAAAFNVSLPPAAN